MNQDEIAEKLAAKKKREREVRTDAEEMDLGDQLGRQPANDTIQRVELTGESILVTRWANGHLPCRNRWLGDVITACIE